jgi:hypothetical protein
MHVVKAIFVHDPPIDSEHTDSEHAELTTKEGETITVPWSELDDCSHFISCCLGHGGGFAIPPGVPGVYGQTDAPNLVRWLAAHRATKVLGRSKRGITLNPAEARAQLPVLEAGDVIGYFSPKHKYTHTTLYLGNGKIACHTYCRSDQIGCTWDNEWNLGEGEGFAYTFIHML